MKGLVALLACLVLFGPERFPLDAGMHTEIRVMLCTETGWGGASAAVLVETRTYERVQNADGGYTVTVLSPGEDGWTAVARAPLYLTTQEPAP